MEDQTILASDPNLGNISVCPGGIVHINLPHCSLKLVPSDFVRFSELMARARANFKDETAPTGAKPHLQLVPPKKEEHSPED